VWDWSSVKLIDERKVAPAHVSGVSYTGEGQRLVVSERTGAVYMIDGETVEVAGPRVPLNMRIFEVYGRDNRSPSPSTWIASSWSTWRTAGWCTKATSTSPHSAVTSHPTVAAS
jgi:hypothetical protein